MKLQVVEATTVAGDVRMLTLKHPRRPALPKAEPGAHVDVRLPDGKVRQYSLCGDPEETSTYRIAVKLQCDGGGGSRWIHENLRVGSVAHVSAPRNNFPIAADAAHHLLVAGGIGITPLAAMAYSLQRRGLSYSLHYCARTAAQAPLLAELRALCGDRLRTWFSGDGAGARFDATAALADRPPGAHVYCCGPSRLVGAVRAAASHWAEGSVHVEMFSPLVEEGFAPASFTIRIASSGLLLEVPADRTALEILREHGFAVPSSCEIGVCGSCECGYSSGTVIHRDVVLEAAARRSRMLPCVSRAEGSVVLDL